MVKRNQKVILTDCDGVILDWEEGFAVWMEHHETDANIAWTRRIFENLTPFLADGRYVNYLDDDEEEFGSDPVRAAYGPNYDRLVEVKTKYDPENMFHLNFNIPPNSA